MEIVNLTPHEITFMGGKKITIPASGNVARVSVKRKQVGTLNGLPIYRSVFGWVVNLPDPKPDTVYIVSAMVAQAVQGVCDYFYRDDIYIVDDKDIVRDENGRIIGCRGLGVI